MIHCTSPLTDTESEVDEMDYGKYLHEVVKKYKKFNKEVRIKGPQERAEKKGARSREWYEGPDEGAGLIMGLTWKDLRWSSEHRATWWGLKQGTRDERLLRLRTVPTNTEVFMAVYDYPGKADLSKG